MTLPYERGRAIQYAQDFLRDLLDPKKTPRVPKDIRRRAGRVLRHYPSNFELNQMRKKIPDLIGQEEKV